LHRSTLNLGILAHVDAGKTSLTERLLYAAGVIDEIGSVDAGSTQTDVLALERQRGITIKSAVVSFAIDDVAVNLIDTPGHPDFIAEVERALRVLDGAVLVLSAVEGVQAQTRLLMRALQRLRVPTLLFVNKIDRAGADASRVLEHVALRLTRSIVPLGTVRSIGTREAAYAVHDPDDRAFRDALTGALAEHDDAILSAWVEGRPLAQRRLRRALARQTRRGVVHPVLFGSAITGAGVDELREAIATLLPPAAGDAEAPASGTVFKVERGPAGENIAYVRMYAGTVRIRDRLRFGRGLERKVTAIAAFDGGAPETRAAVTAGQIGKLRGLAGIQIGDAVGTAPPNAGHRFAPPTLETVVIPGRPADLGALRVALGQLAEQDPLIDLRQDDDRRELSLSLYGEVQKEVIQATLADEYGLHVAFRETTTICVERPVATGEAVALMKQDGNPFLATVGLRVDPAPVGDGVTFGLEVELGSMPYAFFRAVEDTVRATLRRGGLHGWEVPDCRVTMTRSGYAPRQSHAHQGFNKSMSSTGADFRGLTPLVLRAALGRAGTRVCEPVHRFHLEASADTLGALVPALARLRAVPGAPVVRGSWGFVEGGIPAARVHELRLQLPGLTRGEGVLEAEFDRYEPVAGRVPERV
jgi:ribosomal protection tetracycline resistance protein